MYIDDYEYKGYTIQIHTDELAEDPRNWGNLGKMLCFHKRYILGDKHDTLFEYDFVSWDEVETFIYENYDPLLVIPIYMYDHSGITVRTYPFSCPWDSGQIGFIYVSKSDIRKEFGVKKISRELTEQVRKILISEVDIYDKYLRGEIYGYLIEDPVTEEHIGSCYGFYGDDFENNGLLDYAKPEIDYYIKALEQEIAYNRELEIGG